MKFAISNIAWRADEDEAVAKRLPDFGITGIEIAPTRVWADPLRATSAHVTAQRRYWENHGLSIVAMQSLLFGHPELTLFGTEEKRAAMLTYLFGMISLARDLGAQVLVFGSPKNRKVGALSPTEAQAIAVPFFRELGNRAADAGVCFCIEPNPSYYDCDFVTTSAQGLALAAAVNSPGFGLHLDAAGMTLAGEDPDAALTAAAGHIRHFHVSEKDLAPIGAGSVDHARFGAALRRLDYKNWISVEMRPTPVPAPESGSRVPLPNLPNVQKALETLQSHYGL
jgi:D-psicose/D-tagatose/L-ribulose 3-epimerase